MTAVDQPFGPVTFGALWRRSVIAICRTHLVAGAGSERVVSVSYPMGYESLRLRNTSLRELRGRGACDRRTFR